MSALRFAPLAGRRFAPLAGLSRVCALAAALAIGGAAWADEPGPESGEGKAEGHEQHAGEAHHGEAHHGEAHHGEHPAPLDNWFSLSFGPGKEKQNGPLAFAILNFVVLVWLVVRFGRKPLQAYLRDRHSTIRRELEEAARLHKEAEGKLAAIDGKLRDLDREIAGIKEAVARDADEERQRIIANAEAEAQRIVQMTEEQLKRELRNAQRRLEVEAVDSAIRAAEKLIRQSLTDDDRKRLNDEYYKQLAS
jgi:F-type H+-transporting ATPase subunit b